MDSLDPKVYIILVNYNGYRDTIECIDSLEKINYNNYNIIVIDNKSSDGSAAILTDRFPDIKIIENEQNIGFSGANNIGINYAIENGAEYILLLNNDTTVDSNFLKVLVDNCKKDKSVGICIGKIYFYKEKRKIWYAGGYVSKFKGNVYHNGYNEVDTGVYDKISKVTFATGCCMLIPKEVILNIGLLSEDYFLYYEDADYCCKISNGGLSILYCPASVIYHKISASTGELSQLSQYYLIRNRNIFINRNIKGVYKLISFLFYYLFLFVKMISGKQDGKIMIRAIKDFIRKRTGKQF